MEKNKRYERGIKLFFAILCVIILVPIILLVAFGSFINNTDLVIGITGFAQKVAFRSVLSLVALIIAIVCLIKMFRCRLSDFLENGWSLSEGDPDSRLAGADLQLPGGLMLGWATVEDVIDQYGEPSDRYENYNVTYELEGAEYTKHLDLTFYNGFLSGIVIQNHEYYREY